MSAALPERVVIVVDNVERDLPGLVLLAAHLCGMGLECYLVPWNPVSSLQGEAVWCIAPSAVIVNYVRKNNDALVGRFAKAGAAVFVLDTEGGIIIDFDQYALFMSDDQNVLSSLECYCSWGSQLAAYVAEVGWFTNSKVQITGCPRFDFYQKPWRHAAAEIAGQASSNFAAQVLVLGSFAFSNPRFKTPEEELDLHVNHFGEVRKDVIERQERGRRGMLELVEMTKALSRSFPDVRFVYRPHPFENAGTYDSLIDESPNLVFAQKGTVDGWILQSDAIIQQGSTTAVEAGFAQIPALSPAWIPSPLRAWNPVPESLAVQCNDFSALKEVLGEIVSGHFRIPDDIQSRLSAVALDWFGEMDGRASERVAHCIVSRLAGKDDETHRREQCADILNGEKGRFERPFRRRIAEVLRSAMGWGLDNPDAESNSGAQSDPGPVLKWSLRKRLRRMYLIASGQSANWRYRGYDKWRAIQIHRWRSSPKFFQADDVERIATLLHRSGADRIPALDVSDQSMLANGKDLSYWVKVSCKS